MCQLCLTAPLSPGFVGRMLGVAPPAGVFLLIKQMGNDRTLKYASEVEDLVGCPPNGCAPAERELFRFVHKERDPNSFLPNSVKTPSRRNNPNPDVCCSNYALSMFDTEGNARREYSDLVRRYKNFGKSVGKHLAKGVVTRDDGMQTETDDSGHVDVHEFSGAVLYQKFEVIGDLQ